MNDNQHLQKIITSIHRRRYVLYLLLAFLAGCLDESGNLIAVTAVISGTLVWAVSR